MKSRVLLSVQGEKPLPNLLARPGFNAKLFLTFAVSRTYPTLALICSRFSAPSRDFLESLLTS